MATDNDSDNRRDGDRPKRGNFSFDALFGGLPGLAGQTFARAVGQSGNLLEYLLKTPEQMEQVGKAGSYLKDLREVTGLTLDDLARATDIRNPDLLRSIEEGRSPVTLDILYRLASFYSRNDPVSFVLNFSREYAPWLWQVLRVTGMEKLLITAERELKFINVYRARESARHLSDEDFDKMLGFVRSGFNMAMDFIEPVEEERRPPKAGEEAKKQKTTKSGTAGGGKKPAKARTATGTATGRKSTASAKSASGKAAPRKTPAKNAKTATTRQRKKP